MSESLFKTLERAPLKSTFETQALLEAIPWNQDGLMPAIAQQYDTHEVLMMAWMNRDTLTETLATERVCYWSRSRQRAWRKGESSGQVQMLKAAYLDCDGDTVLLMVDQQGPACHTGRRSCFYTRIEADEARIVSDPQIAPETLYGHTSE